ncbi:MAG: NAD(FAD)-dependent dehydrogenase [Spirochaetae bacterium HGW-Spirochaetae-1]|jgi:CxxC motif-containing protein|nr:MAG: NAD(FAD)-dependent dehydrogenase [Spirochaetae bacterium HGW-Spirochaetae-1]
MEHTAAVITCISCPLGCAIEIERSGEEFTVQGNRCKKGKDYAQQELVCPMRSITSTVQTSFHDFPRLSVKTDREVPLREIFHFMTAINVISVDKRMKPGDVVARGLCGSEVNLVATGDMSEIAV